MEIAKLVLEYLKVLLSAPVILSLVAILFILLFREDIKALILRIAKIKLPGGTEVSTPQSNQLAVEEQKPVPQPSVDDQVPVSGLPTDLTQQQRTSIEQLIRSHIATAYIWEYRYLNYFLARGTQHVLDWLIGLSQPTTYAHFESVWIPIIPSANERQAIITALQAHHLIQQERSGLIVVTPKGREYQEWRGTLPPLTNGSTGHS
jgi:hypothetical protein